MTEILAVKHAENLNDLPVAENQHVRAVQRADPRKELLMSLLDWFLKDKHAEDRLAWVTWISWRPRTCGSCSQRIARFSLVGVRLYSGLTRQYICHKCHVSVPYYRR
jgi:hypothetical protein